MPEKKVNQFKYQKSYYARHREEILQRERDRRLIPLSEKRRIVFLKYSDGDGDLE